MVTVTGRLQKDAWGLQVLPPVEFVRSGLWSIPVPIPGSALRYVLCYCIETGAGPVLVDPGWPEDVGWNALRAGMAVAGFAVADVHAVLLTHAHTDHHGLAARVRDESGCWVGMHEAESRALRGMRDGSTVNERNDRWLSMCGVSAEDATGLLMDADRMRGVSALTADRLLGDGETVLLRGRRITTLWTPGHTPGHLCFLLPDESIVLTGDHLLPRITSNISSYGLNNEDPLGCYLDSLGRLAHFDDHEALPGHEYRFRDIGTRISLIGAHHADRLREIRDYVAGHQGTTVWGVARNLTWSRSWEETTGQRRRLALAETLAHLRWLQAREELTCVVGTPSRWEWAAKPLLSS